MRFFQLWINSPLRRLYANFDDEFTYESFLPKPLFVNLTHFDVPSSWERHGVKTLKFSFIWQSDVFCIKLEVILQLLRHSSRVSRTLFWSLSVILTSVSLEKLAVQDLSERKRQLHCIFWEPSASKHDTWSGEWWGWWDWLLGSWRTWVSGS